MSTRPLPTSVVPLGILLLIGGCATARLTRTELYLGMSTKASQVTDREFEAFLNEVVTPRFPDGYTVVRAEGRWRGAAQDVTAAEPTRLLIIVHAGTELEDAKIQAIAKAYRDRFDQEAVLRVDQAAKSSLILSPNNAGR